MNTDERGANVLWEGEAPCRGRLRLAPWGREEMAFYMGDSGRVLYVASDMECHLARLLAAEQQARQALESREKLWLEYVQLLADVLDEITRVVQEAGYERKPESVEAGKRLRAALGLDSTNRPADNARAVDASSSEE